MANIRIKVAHCKKVDFNGHSFKVFSAVDKDGKWYTVKTLFGIKPLDSIGYLCIDSDNVDVSCKVKRNKDGEVILNKHGEAVQDNVIWIKGEYTVEAFPKKDITTIFDYND